MKLREIWLCSPLRGELKVLMNSCPPWVWRGRKNPRSTPSANTSTPAQLHFSAELTPRIILGGGWERKNENIPKKSIPSCRSRAEELLHGLNNLIYRTGRGDNIRTTCMGKGIIFSELFNQNFPPSPFNSSMWQPGVQTLPLGFQHHYFRINPCSGWL